MVLIQEFPDALPHLDPEPSPSARAAIDSLISSELDASHTTTLHASVPTWEPTFTLLMQQELRRIDSKAPRDPNTGIDLSRYEALSAADADPTHPENELEAWKRTLRRAYTSHSYLTERTHALALLETFGKNAWLIGNHDMEAILRGLEKELAQRRDEVEQVDAEREGMQREVEGELRGLETAWKTGVRMMVETGVAVETLRAQVLERRRAAA
ncbi:hypothetical protein P152DRAFT_448707 [Eremomyces bilateralis CBS 781.70]|uniref:BCAS2 family protein n=1 Tax=Eremomyces bilateralis CBS 781.70 TaxID=1392243 RepID=A0A6G1G626_9PEZI|nr:uncharacterized protein P152DRAFT_448707 [Eremomyces bilateralis CBS 781.70]KAF1813401.1 hypothetical protein P152DRAFT_448707 [Eremomyces bilateralis CBS 781.70]